MPLRLTRNRFIARLPQAFLAPACHPRRRRQHRPREPHPHIQPVTSPKPCLLHSTPEARHPSRGVRRLCSHRGTIYMDVVPILTHPLTRSQRLCSTINTLAARIECPADMCACCACFTYASLGLQVRTTRDSVIVCDVLIEHFAVQLVRVHNRIQSVYPLCRS